MTTAYFTFRSAVIPFTQLPANGDLLPFVLSAGTLSIYFNAQPTGTGDWTNPDSFSSGHLIATLKSPDGLFLQFISSDPPATLPFEISELPVSRQSFTFKGKTYDFSSVAPGGLMLFNTVSVRPLLTGITGFPFVFPYAGSGIAAGPPVAAMPVPAYWNQVTNTQPPPSP